MTAAAIAACCDFVYAADHARFALPEVTLGILPGVGERRPSHGRSVNRIAGFARAASGFLAS